MIDLSELFPDAQIAQGEIEGQVVSIQFGPGVTPLRMNIDRMANCLDVLRRAQTQGIIEGKSKAA